MTITHAISTERLVNVLQSIALKQRTGCLSIERMYAQEEETGDIFFERGETVFALSAQQSGETALHTMLRWKHISYTFKEGIRHVPSHAAGRTENGQTASSLDMRRLSSIKAQESRQTPPLGMPVIAAVPPPFAIDMIETQLLPPRSRTDALPPVLFPMQSPVTAPARSDAFTRHDTGEHQQIAGQVARMGDCEQMGIGSIFRALPVAGYSTTLNRLDRRDRVVLLLLNGKRTLHDVALLVHRSEIETARVIVRLLRQGYVEYIGEE